MTEPIVAIAKGLTATWELRPIARNKAPNLVLALSGAALLEKQAQVVHLEFVGAEAITRLRDACIAALQLAEPGDPEEAAS